MGLDIGVGVGASAVPQPNEPVLTLDDDPYYWFMSPLFESLYASTGQIIDLYGAASFSGSDLALVQAMLVDARNAVLQQPAQWEVCVGLPLVSRQTRTRKKAQFEKRFATATKEHFLTILDQWDQIVLRARELQQAVVCFGD